MSDCIIQEHLSLTELYNRLLRTAREIERAQSNGSAICIWCARPGEKHLPDKRCSSSAVSRDFLDSRNEEGEKVRLAIDLIEQLLEIDR